MSILSLKNGVDLAKFWGTRGWIQKAWLGRGGEKERVQLPAWPRKRSEEGPGPPLQKK